VVLGRGAGRSPIGAQPGWRAAQSPVIHVLGPPDPAVLTQDLPRHPTRTVCGHSAVIRRNRCTSRDFQLAEQLSNRNPTDRASLTSERTYGAERTHAKSASFAAECRTFSSSRTVPCGDVDVRPSRKLTWCCGRSDHRPVRSQARTRRGPDPPRLTQPDSGLGPRRRVHHGDRRERRRDHPGGGLHPWSDSGRHRPRDAGQGEVLEVIPDATKR